jgi:hypothetical protein
MTQDLSSGAWDWFFVVTTAVVLLGDEVALFAVERVP